jgi:hypothetical protein
MAIALVAILGLWINLLDYRKCNNSAPGGKNRACPSPAPLEIESTPG